MKLKTQKSKIKSGFMNKVNLKGEITTLITLGAFLIIGISSLVSSLFLKNKISTTPKAQTANSFSCGNGKGAVDANDACNIACCDKNANGNNDCPNSQTCGVPNGQCKSGLSCAGNAPGYSSPRYIRACLGGNCAWTWCDGNNFNINECTSDVNTLGQGRDWCSSDNECQTRQPINYGNVTMCNGGNGKSVSCSPDGIATYDRQCIYKGKAWEVHRQCSQSNTDGCYYWCKGAVSGNRYNCLDSNVSLLDDSTCTAANLPNPPTGQQNPTIPSANPIVGSDSCNGTTVPCGALSGKITLNGYTDLYTHQYLVVIVGQRKSADDSSSLTGSQFTMTTVRITQSPMDWSWGNGIIGTNYKIQAKLVDQIAGRQTDVRSLQDPTSMPNLFTPTGMGSDLIDFTFNSGRVTPVQATPTPTPRNDELIFKVSGRVVNDAYQPDSDVADKLGNYVVIMKVTSTDPNVKPQIDAQDNSEIKGLSNNTDSSNYESQVNLHISQGTYGNTSFTCSLTVAKEDDLSQTNVATNVPLNINNCKYTAIGQNTQLYVLHIKQDDVTKVDNNKQVDFTISGKLVDLESHNFVSLDKDLSFKEPFSSNLSNSDYEVNDKTIKDDGTYSVKISVYKKGSIKNNTRFRVEVVSKLAGSIGKIENLKYNNGDITSNIPVESDYYNLEIKVGATGHDPCADTNNPSGSCIPIVYFDTVSNNNYVLQVCYDVHCSGVKSTLTSSSFTRSTRDGFGYVGRTYTFGIPYYGGDYSKMRIKAFKDTDGILSVSDIKMVLEKSNF